MGKIQSNSRQMVLFYTFFSLWIVVIRWIES